MTTKRKYSKSISTTGVKFTRDVVNSHNCIFQEVDLENDIGNDAYIEFTENEEATGCSIFVQIKSGSSYTKPDGNYFFSADKDHFEYWSSHCLPVAIIIYNPINNQAVWCDITEYLTQHPMVIEDGPYTVNISAAQQFSNGTFKDFASHFMTYLDAYKYSSKLGSALQKFADRENLRNCFDGLTYLHTFQRQSITSWYYVISCYHNFRKHPLLLHLTAVISYLPGHEDIFWHKHNIINENTRKAALDLLKERFGREEIIAMLEIVKDGGGFARGAIGQCVYAIVCQIKNHEIILESILSDLDIGDETRYWGFLLLIYFTQFTGIEKCIELANKYKHSFSDEEISQMAKGMTEELEKNKRFYLIC